MKKLLTLSIWTIASVLCVGAQTHLDIMVPDLKDTALKGPIKSVTVKLWQNVSDEYTTETRAYDRTGNLTRITERDNDGKLIDQSVFVYDEAGCYTAHQYSNEEEDYESDWEVVLNPDTRQIALREKTDGRIRIETYSPDGYLISYRLLDENRKQLVAKKYERDEQNRLTRFTRIDEKKPSYTFYFKWAESGFIDMEGQIYHQEKEQRRHTYEYLAVDDHGNWTQRIFVLYDIGGDKPEMLYQNTVKRAIEYYDSEDRADVPSDDGTAAGATP